MTATADFKQTAQYIGLGYMRFDNAHRLRGVRHPLGHHKRDCKRSVPSGDRCNRGYPFHHCLLRLHPLVIHPLTLTDMAKRNSKTAAQQCRYYEVDNIFEYMVETYINGNFSTFRETIPRTEQGRTEGLYRFPSQRGRADLLERDTETDNLKTTAI